MAVRSVGAWVRAFPRRVALPGAIAAALIVTDALADSSASDDPRPRPAPHAEAAPYDHGAAVYRQLCAFCHDDGQLGAPVRGDVTAWDQRRTRPLRALFESAAHGTGHMPARANWRGFGEDDVWAALAYLLAESGGVPP